MRCICASPKELLDADAACYVDEHLRPVWCDHMTSDTEHVCPITGRRWLEDRLHAEWHGGGIPRLRAFPIPELDAQRKRAYAMATIQWLPDYDRWIRDPLRGRVEFSAEFEGHSDALHLVLPEENRPGTSVTVPVAEMAEGKMPHLLGAGASFRLIARNHCIAEGEIVSGIEWVGLREFYNLFRFVRPLYAEPAAVITKGRYATAEVTWLQVEGLWAPSPEEELYTSAAAAGRLFADVLLTADDTADYSLYLMLEKDVRPGDVLAVPIAPVVDHVGDVILRPGVNFRVGARMLRHRDGPRAITVPPEMPRWPGAAEGHVVEVHEIEQAQFERLFRMDEPEQDWHQPEIR